MSQDNAAVVRRFYELFPDLAAGPPPPALFELFHPEVRIDQTRNVFNPASYEGRDGLARALEVVGETWEYFVLEPERFAESGDHVVVIQSVRARGLGGGVEVLDRSATLHTLRDGLVVYLAVYPDPDEGLRAAGIFSR
jgi:ketosteroid isomerase-like protein